MGAGGILPATLVNNKLYFLFGKEQKFDETPGWSDFAGGQEEKESQFQTAIREGSEELTGFLGTEKDVKRLLTQHGTYNLDLDTYRTHIFPIQYDESLPFYYNNNQRFLQKRLKPDVFKKYRIFEKAEIQWVCADDLLTDKRQYRFFYKAMIKMLYEQREKIDAFVRTALDKNGRYKRSNKKTRKNH